MKKKDTTIIFQEGTLSKALKINHKSIKQFFTTLSILFIALVISMVLTILFYQNKFDQIKGDRITQIDSLKAQNSQQAGLIQNLRDEASELRGKISEPAKKISDLSLFSLAKGSKNLMTKNLLLIEDIKTEYLEGSGSLKFNLINSKKAGKVSGYVYTLLYSNQGIQIAPKSNTFSNAKPLDFHKGESFTVSRFRPFEAKFDINKKLKNVSYRVIIFSRTGDTILDKTIGPINLKDLNP